MKPDIEAEMASLDSRLKRIIETMPTKVRKVSTRSELRTALSDIFGELVRHVALDVSPEMEYNLLLPRGWGLLSDLLPFADDEAKKIPDVGFTKEVDMLEITNDESVVDTLNRLYSIGKPIVRFTYYGKSMVALVVAKDGLTQWYVAPYQEGIPLGVLRHKLMGIIRRNETIPNEIDQEDYYLWCEIEGVKYRLPIVLTPDLMKEVFGYGRE